ncbi:MAG: diguanylate cyclase domain-containing protein [bacterium]
MKTINIYNKIKNFTDDINLMRAILLGATFIYIIYGAFFRTASEEGVYLLPRGQRYFSAFILFTIFIGSYWSKYIKENIISICIYFGIFASLQMVVFLHIQNYPVNHANAMIVVIMLINLLFNKIRPLIFYNIIIFSVILFSVLMVNDPEVHKCHYLIILFSITLLSFVFAFIRKSQENEIKQQQKKYKELVNNTPDFIYSLDKNGQYLAVNNKLCEELGVEKDRILGENISGLDFAEDFLNEFSKIFDEVLSKKEKVKKEIQFSLWKNEDKYYVVELIPILDENNQIKKIRGMNRDITERKKAEKEIEYKSFHDELTDLYNRSYFEEELKRYDTERQLPLSIIMGDVNGLKLVNDAFGHQEGDKLLKTIADILKSCCRNEDITARWGGDEFVILLPQTTQKEVGKIAKRIKNKIQNTEMDPINPSMALGYATKKEKEEDVDNIFKKAENWMYKKKLTESKNVHGNIINSLKKTLQESAHENYEHCQRIKNRTIELGKCLGLSESKLTDLELLAELHDLGKVAISNDILEKEKDLTTEERQRLNKHPEIGYQIAKSTPQLNHIAEALLHHHENWNGTGYPHQLEGEDIPYLARILKVVNEYDKMINYHPHVETVSKEKAIKKMKEGAGSKFDPEIVEMFINQVLEEKT